MPPSIPPAERRPTPSPARSRPRPGKASETAASAARLRLAIARAGLGIELAEPVRLGCLHVAELELAITTVRFPLDVSGGVARFRHRRGELQRLVVELGARDLERWASPALRGLLGPRSPDVWVGVRRAGATLAVVDDGGASRDGDASASAPPRVLAFEVTVGADGDDLLLYVTAARGLTLPEPPTTLALRAVAGLLGPGAQRKGSAFVLPKASQAIVRALLPDAGVRAPDALGMRWTGFAAQGDRWIAVGVHGGAPADVPSGLAYARETCALTEEADDARAAGDLDRARRLDVASLERAPRHPEIVRRIAEIDWLAGGRAEASLATLASAAGANAEAGTDVAAEGIARALLSAEAHADVHDTAAAVAAFVRAADGETVPALAARAYERAAELTRDPSVGLAWLDRAVARAPRLSHLRWARIARRLAVGRLEDALADAEHLEAQAQGAAARHAVWRRAGDAWVRAGLRSHAVPLFERALRFEPDDPEAVAGLGTALIDAGRPTRGAALLGHAIELAEREGATRGRSRRAALEVSPSLVARMQIELARVLAHPLGDLPASVARLQTVSSDLPEALAARALEGRLRAELGDLAGASLAYAKLRDLASSRAASPDGASSQQTASLVAWLSEAATFERERRDDLLAAQRLYACALRLAPGDGDLQRAYRDVGARLAGSMPLAPTAPEPDAAEEEAPSSSPPSPRATRLDRKTEPPTPGRPFELGLSPPSAAYPGEAEDAARVEELTRLLQLDPTQDAIVDELADRLTRLGRTHELLAVLSARLEDASPERRAALAPQQRAVLERLEEDARAAGRDLEAAFFRDALVALRTS